MKNLRNVIMLFAASAAMIACQNNGKTAANAAGTDSAATDTMATDSAVYEGEIPGADAGSVYTLKIKLRQKTIAVRRLLPPRKWTVKT